MKTILVDAIDGLILEDGSVFTGMHDLLETYPNRKIVLTGANDEQWKRFNLGTSPYEVFTLKHDPEKTDPKYFQILFEEYDLTPGEVIYFEHNGEAVDTARSLGIQSYFYDHTKQDLAALKNFIDSCL